MLPIKHATAPDFGIKTNLCFVLFLCFLALLCQMHLHRNLSFKEPWWKSTRLQIRDLTCGKPL